MARVSLGTNNFNNDFRQRRRLVPAAGLIAALISGLLIGGCAGSTAVQTFNLSAPKQGIQGRAGRGQLVIMEPVATSPYDSDRLVVRSTASTVALLADAQWVDELPKLLQSRIVQTFENGRLLRAVGRPGDRLVAAVSLNTEIRRFDIDVATGQAVVEIAAKIINDSRGRIQGARIFTAKVSASAASGRVAAEALDRALDRLLRDLVAWSSRFV